MGRSPVGYPPYHYNCRTAIGYLAKGQESLEGTRAAVGGKSGEDAKEAFERRKDRTDGKVRFRGRRDSSIFDPGQVKADTKIDAWLKKQPKWFVESTLGKERAQLFLKGDLSLARFTDMTGDPLTLDQLRRLDAEAFERAGLG